MTPKQSLREAKLISDQMWQFHNDRLSDPTITDMTPYITPILANQQRAIAEGRIDELRLFKCRTANVKDGTSWDKWDKRISDNINTRITTLSNQIEGDK